jgi:hypothetical protein
MFVFQILLTFFKVSSSNLSVNSKNFIYLIKLVGSAKEAEGCRVSPRLWVDGRVTRLDKISQFRLLFKGPCNFLGILRVQQKGLMLIFLTFKLRFDEDILAFLGLPTVLGYLSKIWPNCSQSSMACTTKVVRS